MEDEDDDEDEEDRIARNAERQTRNAARETLHVKPKHHDVAVLDFVFFALNPEFSGLAGFGE
jgi:hypothetical protein